MNKKRNLLKHLMNFRFILSKNKHSLRLNCQEIVLLRKKKYSKTTFVRRIIIIVTILIIVIVIIIVALWSSKIARREIYLKKNKNLINLISIISLMELLCRITYVNNSSFCEFLLLNFV